MVDDLDNQAEHTADQKYPEQVEEVELDVAFAGEVAPEHALFGGGAILQVAQAALKVALLLQGGVDGGGQRGEDADLDERAYKVKPDALQHDIDEQLAHGEDDQRVGPARSVAAVAADEGPPEQDEGHRRDEAQDGADGGDGGGERDVAADERLGGVGCQPVGGDAEVGTHERKLDDAVERAQAAVHLHEQADGPALFGGDGARVQVVAGQVVVDGLALRVVRGHRSSFGCRYSVTR